MDKEFFKYKSSNIGALSNFLISPKNIKYLEYLKDSIPEYIWSRTISEMVYYFLSENKPIIFCSCGSALKFIGFKNGYRKTCGRKNCIVSSREQTNIEKWGVTNPMKSPEILKKIKNTINERWDGRAPMSHEKIKEKWRSSVLNNLGVTSPQKNEKVRKKSLQTWRSNPNREEIIERRANLLRDKTSQEKNKISEKKRETLTKKWGTYEKFINYRLDRIKSKSLEKWDSDHHLKAKEIIDKRTKTYKQSKIKKIISLLPDNLTLNKTFLNENGTDSYIELICTNCSTKFEITRQLLYLKCEKDINPCLICNPNEHGSSKSEKELLKFIVSNYDGVVIPRYKLDGREIDIFIPEMNIGFEFNGLWWHSELFKDKNFHKEKTLFFMQRGISIFHIWEDDWTFKRNIMNSLIKHKLNRTKNKISARVCEVKELDTSEANKFLIDNYLGKPTRYTCCIGLTFKQELVCIMSFQENQIVNYCSKVDHIVVGGFSKLLSFYLRKFKYEEMFTFFDTSMFTGDVLKFLEFKKTDVLDPEYSFIKKSRRFSDNGDYRIADCGKEKWVLERTRLKLEREVSSEIRLM